MLVIPGQPGKDLCDRELGVTRRHLLRVGGAGMLGLVPGLETAREFRGRPVATAAGEHELPDLPYDYDALGRRDRVDLADGKVQTRVYDPHGNVVQRVDANGTLVGAGDHVDRVELDVALLLDGAQ